MSKFDCEIQVEETRDFQEWLAMHDPEWQAEFWKEVDETSEFCEKTIDE